MRDTARFCSICGQLLEAIPPPASLSPQPVFFGTGGLLPLAVLADRYVILEKIAQGGMGAVYRAQDKRLQDKIVAVKEMSESAIEPEERQWALESFRREAQLLARLDHPNLVRVTDCFQEREHQYMVSEFIEGQTIEKMLERHGEPFSEERVLIWAEQLCDVLFYLHSQSPKIIYRDVKPTNVMVVENTDVIKLIDFGIARFFKPGKRRDTIEFGTEGYASPEQYGKSQTDERSDIYSLGAMIHHLLTLRAPNTEPFSFPPVRRLNPKVSRRVEGAIAKAVASNKRKRHQSMREMWQTLAGEEIRQSQRAPATKSAKVKPAQPTKPATPAKLASVSTAVDFGNVMVGSDTPPHSLVVPLAPGETAALSTDAPWLHVHPQNVDDNGAVTLTLETGRLTPGRLQLRGGWPKRWVGWHTRRLVPVEQAVQAHVEIESKSGQLQRVPVSVTVVPRPWQVLVGWAMTIGALLLEATVVIGTLGAIIFPFL